MQIPIYIFFIAYIQFFLFEMFENLSLILVLNVRSEKKFVFSIAILNSEKRRKNNENT
jgi:hypothetical protein